MSDLDPLSAWRRNPFYVLEVKPEATRAEFERAGQKLLGLLELGTERAKRYDTPFGPTERDADMVRQALAALRDPVERMVHELWASVALDTGEPPVEETVAGWADAERALGWKCADTAD